MKILYAIQGTGNGHISRARDIIPLLQEKGTLDILVSGTEADVSLGYPVKYKLKGMSFVFGKHGGIDMISTYKKARLKRFYHEVKKLPVKDYDIVINDFEPVSAWACRINHKTCTGLSHQAAVLNKKSPVPAGSDMIGRSILNNYAPVTEKFGFHFKAYDTHIFTPVIRNEIRMARNIRLPHYTVYLPAYEDKAIIKALKEVKHIEWEVFSKHSRKSYREKNVSIRAIDNQAFIDSLVSCTGVLCGAGFETPAEALFLGKKLMVIPMKGQFEQQCNAAALEQLGVCKLDRLSDQFKSQFYSWMNDAKPVQLKYEHSTEMIVERLFSIQQESRSAA